MKRIVFYRKGFANNSSSSHSLIFTSKRDDLFDDCPEDYNFGWDNFTLIDKGSKQAYFLICLYDSWKAQLTVEHNLNDDILDTADVEDFHIKTFLKWMNKNDISNVSGFSKKELKQFKEKIINGQVDHQSHIIFPTHRDASKGLNTDFIKFWFHEISEPTAVLLGGSDNDGEHKYSDLGDLNQENEDLLQIYNFMRESYGDFFCEYDSVAEEFILSSTSNGGIMRIAAKVEI